MLISKKHLTTRGFSLIELMVVIAIIAVLAALAVPAYRAYVTRSKLTTVIYDIEVVKQQSVEYYNNNGHWPTLTNLGFATGHELDNDIISQFTVTPGGCAAAAGVNDYSGDYCIQVSINRDAAPAIPPSVSAPIFIYSLSAPNGSPYKWICTTTAVGIAATSSIPSYLLPPGCMHPDD